ncbi:MAG: sugar phosphate nucleotidyltransferase [Candidatus Manganitrophus sp.]|nr:MAG: sugar phosphate nucleotidyltransferase [Candidatus Manganitrophus sp.]
MTDRFQPSDLCGIVLAAGEGKRLQPLVRRWRGDDLPKQYVQFTESRSLLQQTIDRARRLIPSDRLFTIVDRKHLGYAEVWRQIENRPRGTVILQPENKETGPGVLLPLMRVYKYHPNSTVVIFPSDHFIRQENLFIDHVDLACRLVAEDPSRLILLGMQPTGPDPEYGYILPGGEIGHLSPSGVLEAIRFIEKPEPRAASELVRRGGLWNTMVMVVKTKRLLALARAVAPELLGSFDTLLDAIGTPEEVEAAQAIYRNIPSINFSKDLLERFPLQDPSSLAVLPVRGVYWSDWGSVHRVVSDLRKMGQISPLLSIEEDESLLVGQSR